MRGCSWIALLLTALSLVLPVPHSQARIIGRSPEVSVGRETAAIVEKILPVDKDPVAVARVRQIGRRLASCIENPKYGFEFHVIEDGEVNAFALPGGYVYVYKGLLQLLPDDDSLAFVIGHEITHVTQSHAIRQFEKNVLISSAVSGVLLGTGTGGFIPQAANVVQVIVGLSFSRHDETDADIIGIKLMERAGYGPKSAAEAMKVIKRATGNGKDVPALLRSHPAPDSRITRLGELSTELESKRSAARPAAAVPAPPAPAADERLGGLDAVEVAPCEWFPLVEGARWSYRLKSGGLESRTSVAVLEAIPGKPAGVFRVEYDLGRRVKTVRLVAPAGDRFLSRSEKASPGEAWRVDAVAAPGERIELGGDSLRYAGTESVTVPAGTFTAHKVERVAADGTVHSPAWYAKGVGLVKRETAGAAVEELVAYTVPASPSVESGPEKS
jgi:Zn-dependent protease with chaperone function